MTGLFDAFIGVGLCFEHNCKKLKKTRETLKKLIKQKTCHKKSLKKSWPQNANVSDYFFSLQP